MLVANLFGTNGPPPFANGEMRLTELNRELVSIRTPPSIYKVFPNKPLNGIPVTHHLPNSRSRSVVWVGTSRSTESAELCAARSSTSSSAVVGHRSERERQDSSLWASFHCGERLQKNVPPRAGRDVSHAVTDQAASATSACSSTSQTEQGTFCTLPRRCSA